jgi:hypothetical protein
MSTEKRPEKDTLVWWRYKQPLLNNYWSIGRVYGNGVLGTDGLAKWYDIEWQKARILAPNEVAVDIPTFPDGCNQASLRWHYESDYEHTTESAGVTITRDEAEKLEEHK